MRIVQTSTFILLCASIFGCARRGDVDRLGDQVAADIKVEIAKIRADIEKSEAKTNIAAQTTQSQLRSNELSLVALDAKLSDLPNNAERFSVIVCDTGSTTAIGDQGKRVIIRLDRRTGRTWSYSPGVYSKDMTIQENWTPIGDLTLIEKDGKNLSFVAKDMAAPASDQHDLKFYALIREKDQ